MYAAGMSQRNSGNNDTSKLIKEMISSPTRVTKLCKVITPAQKQANGNKHTPQEALAFFL